MNLSLLRRILDAIDTKNPTSETQTKAYIYAFLAFVASALKVNPIPGIFEERLIPFFKSQADVQHLWFGRRASCRIRSELMAAIYDKALKRKDYSGIINKDKKDEAVNPEDSTDPKRMFFLLILRSNANGYD